MNGLNTFLDFVIKVAITTASHLVWLLGLIFVFGLLLYLFARCTRTSYVNSGKEKIDIFVTGWIGTPIHELGHAVFCILFRHKITEIKLFSPNSTDGSLGYVNHTYNPASRYQKIGNFFIGIGPILFGALALYALLYWLLPELREMFNQIQEISKNTTQDIQTNNWLNIWGVFSASVSSVLSGIFKSSNFLNWRFYIFLYISFCIASHMELSPPDIKGAFNGLLAFVFTIFALNFIIAGLEQIGIHNYAGNFWQYLKIETYAPYINSFLATLGALLIYALIISGLNFAISYIALNIFSLIKRRGIVNPFVR